MTQEEKIEKLKEILKEEQEDINILSYICGVAMNVIGELEIYKGRIKKVKPKAANKLRYKHDLAKYGNKFFELIEKTENVAIKLRDDSVETNDKTQDSYMAVENLIRCSYNLKNDSQRQYFNEEVEKLVNKFNLNNK